MTLGGDDYHQHALRQADGNDQWGYAWENCVSYLCEQSVFDLHIPPPLYGTAWRWPANARAQGKLVTSHPMLWSAACFGRNQNGAGPEGHVALVTAVLGGGGLIDVAEYNFLHPLAFGTRPNVSTAGLTFVELRPPPPAPPPEDHDVAFLASAGKRPAGETLDIHGQGAVYLVNGVFKQYVPAAALSQYIGEYGAVQDWSTRPYVLDRLVEVTATGYPLLVTTAQPVPGKAT